MKISISSPWGAVQTSGVLLDDGDDWAYWVTTAGHGGIKLSPAMESRMPEFMRARYNPGGWYEEDCEWSLLCLCFPAMDWKGDDIQYEARATMANYYPEALKQWDERGGLLTALRGGV